MPIFSDWKQREYKYRRVTSFYPFLFTMKKSMILILLLAVVVVAWCFHKKTDWTAPQVNTTGVVVDTGNNGNDDAFDPNNFEDPEVKEVFDLLEELVQEDEEADVDSGAQAQ